jgi:hypothetical protein
VILQSIFFTIIINIRREKQEENKGRLGIAGLLSKDGKPIV